MTFLLVLYSTNTKETEGNAYLHINSSVLSKYAYNNDDFINFIGILKL
jgi:hypothetical protein